MTSFTLAEVLIVLGIIGLIADMTIPTLINKVNDKVTVTKLKKAYSVLSQATTLATIESGSPLDWELVDTSKEGIIKAFEYYKPHLRLLKDSEEGVYGEDTYTFTLSDGSQITMDLHAAGGADMLNAFGVNTSPMMPGLVMIVDLNGKDKPNQYGRDVFVFVLTPKGLKAAGSENDSINCKANVGWSMRDCAAKVLREEKIDY